MPQKNLKLYNPDTPVTWNIVVNSIHVIAYKLWKQKPESDEWEVLSEGSSTDNIADNGQFNVEAGTKFAYWLGIASTMTNTNYNISLVLSQEQKILEGGMIEETGQTNDDGVWRVLEIVGLI